MPRHPRIVHDRERIAHVVVHILEVHDPCIVEVLAREERLAEVGRMHVGERVRVRVPAPEAQIQAADGGVLVIDGYDLDGGVKTRARVTMEN